MDLELHEAVDYSLARGHRWDSSPYREAMCVALFLDWMLSAVGGPTLYREAICVVFIP